MMKNTLVAAAAALALGSAFAQSSVTLYGRIDTAIQTQNNQNAAGASLTSIDSGAISGSRFGFKGNEDLGGGNNALFQLEGGFSPATGKSGQGGLMFGRQAFMGLGGNWGQLTVGRQYDQLMEHFGAFDPMYGVSNASNTAFYLGYDAAVNGLVRVNNSARYGFSAGGFNAAAMYGTGGVAGNNGAGAYKGLSGSYAWGALNIGAMWQSRDQSSAASGAGANGGTISNSAFGANYGFGPARVFFNYMPSKFNNLSAAAIGSGSPSWTNLTSKVTTLGVTYDITPQIGLTAAYYNDKATTTTATGKRNTLGLGLNYSLSKRTMVYGYLDTTKADATYSSPGATPTTSQNTTMVGVRHSF